MSSLARNLLGVVAVPLALGLAAPAVVLALPFLAVGGLASAISRLLDREAAEWHDLIRFEPEIGWLPVPDVETFHRDLNGDVHRIRTDGDGWRGRGTSVEDADVVAVGDSFAFGNAVGDRAFFANVADGVEIKAMGAPGYSMVQSLMLLDRHAHVLQGKLVVWLVYPGNDLEDNLRPNRSRYRAPFVRQTGSGWEIAADHVSREEWTFPSRVPNFETFVEISAPGSHVSRRAFGAFRWLVRQGRDLCADAGARLAVVTVPDLSRLVQEQIAGVLSDRPELEEQFEAGHVDRRAADICDALGVDFVPLAEHLSEDDYHRWDVHWNRRGNRRVARLLAELHDAVRVPAPAARSGARADPGPVPGADALSGP